MKKPNFFIVGKQKSGTTALYDMLKQHSEVYMPERKETGFFSKDISKEKAILNKREYLNLFKNAEKEKAIGEATASYLNSKMAAKEIKKLIQMQK